MSETYDRERYHEALDKLTPEDVYPGRAWEILTARELVKMQTLEHRKRHNLRMKLRNEPAIRPAELSESVY